MRHKAAVRLVNLKQGSGKCSLAKAERHAKRQDDVAQLRSIGDPSRNYAWSKAGVGLAGGGCDIVRAHALHKKETSAGERSNSAPAMHLLAVVSPSWLRETGDPRDLENPRVMDLIRESRIWAESWCGLSSVFHVRYDTDERGAGVVDLLVAPVRVQKHKSGVRKLVISGRKAREELLAEEQSLDASISTATAAMQSSWARWCQLRLDSRIERGTPKRLTQREHLHADIYARIKEEVREELCASLRAEVRGELAEQEIKAAREMAEEECTRLKSTALQHRVEARRSVISARTLREQLERTEDTYRALSREVESSQEALRRERAKADGQAKLLRRARGSNDPHIAHLLSLMERYVSESPENSAKAKRLALASALAFHEELERAVVEGGHSSAPDLLAALAEAWARNPANALRRASAESSNPHRRR